MPDVNNINFIQLPDEDFVHPIEDTTARVDISNLDRKLLRYVVKYLGVYAATYSSGHYDPDTHLPVSMPIYLDEVINEDNEINLEDHAAVSIQVVFFDNALNYDDFADTVISFAEAPGQTYTEYPVYNQINGNRLKLKDVYEKTVDFVYIKNLHCFYMVGTPVSIEADEVNYDNTTSLLSSTNVQDAIDEVVGELNDKADSSSLATVATSGDYDDLTNKPTIPAAQVNSDWNAVSGVAQILNKPSLSAVATSGDYDDLTNKPTIPADTYRPINIGSTPWLLDNDGLPLSFSSSGTVSISSDSSGKITINGAQADWNETVPARSGYIQNKPTLATVATSGNYSDLNGTPDLSTKQDTLVSGSNIKTINGASVLGSGDIATATLQTTSDTGTVSVGNNSTTKVAQISLTKGLWIITATIGFANTSTNNDRVAIFSTANASSATSNFESYCRIRAAATSWTDIPMSCIYEATGPTTLYLYGLQDSGTTINARCFGIRAAKLA